MHLGPTSDMHFSFLYISHEIKKCLGLGNIKTMNIFVSFFVKDQIKVKN
jgi:hypothetical protein